MIQLQTDTGLWSASSSASSCVTVGGSSPTWPYYSYVEGLGSLPSHVKVWEHGIGYMALPPLLVATMVQSISVSSSCPLDGGIWKWAMMPCVQL